jgi:hypothetical protein
MPALGELLRPAWINALAAALPGWRADRPYIALWSTTTTRPTCSETFSSALTAAKAAAMRSHWRANSARPMPRSRLRTVRPGLGARSCRSARFRHRARRGKRTARDRAAGGRDRRGACLLRAESAREGAARARRTTRCRSASGRIIQARDAWSRSGRSGHTGGAERRSLRNRDRTARIHTDGSSRPHDRSRIRRVA